jgi:choline dehydrogenase-like flavoprotein
MAPYFERVEHRLGIAPVPPEVFGENNRTILKGIEALGMAGVPLLRNAPGCKGHGHCIYGCTSGAKQSMERSYIPAALAAGARLYSHCKAVKLVRRGDHIIEVQAEFYRDRGVKANVRLTVRARRFIVACGTLQTPVLLAQNGIGRQSGQLGKNLSLHPAAKTVSIFDREIDGIKGVPQGLGTEDLHAEGLLFEGVFLPPSLLAASLILPPSQHREVMAAYKRLAIFGFLVSDRSRGRVVGLPDGRPLVLYTMDKRDRERFVKGLAVCARISFAAGATRVLLTTHSYPEMRSASEVDGFLRSRLRATDLEISAFHPLGTARMGVDPGASVVDAQLRVHDLENVYIMDGSIFPSSLGVNPQESIMAFATRLADHLHREIL